MLHRILDIVIVIRSVGPDRSMTQRDGNTVRLGAAQAPQINEPLHPDPTPA
jgi:hypothetical protein